MRSNFFFYGYNKRVVVSAGVCRGDTTRGIVRTFHIPGEIDGMSPVVSNGQRQGKFSVLSERNCENVLYINDAALRKRIANPRIQILLRRQR